MDEITQRQTSSEAFVLLNGDEYDLSYKASEDFIERIQAERHKGFGFVPFVGAGFSAPSGAPLIWEIKPYLQKCICMALGAEEPAMEIWNPRTDQWPPFIDRGRLRREGYWSDLIFQKMYELRKEAPRSNQLPIIMEGFGASANWLTSLNFLSRLEREPRFTDQGADRKAVLSAPRPEVIDACFREVLRGKQPALTHRMLASLAGALRLDVLVTTNFDDLLERAYADARNPLEVFDVRADGHLPDRAAVANVRALVKLHGSRYSLRADYSIDEEPTSLDQRRFLEYLLSPEGRVELGERAGSSDALVKERDGLDFESHLLVMGFSASDPRVCSLIQHAWLHLADGFKVFWLCYSPEDVAATKQLIERINGVRRRPEGAIILRHTQFGLLLLQLYQTVRKFIPPVGSIFPSGAKVPLPPLESTYAKRYRRSEISADFVSTIEHRLLEFDDEQFIGSRLVVVSTTGQSSGVTTLCGDVFRRVENKFVCLWQDMNDISSADNLFEVLIEAAYSRLGIENWTPVYTSNDPVRRSAEIERLVQSTNKRWVIFLNARETPGANTEDGVEHDKSNGWLDVKRKQEADESRCVESFVELLIELCGSNAKPQGALARISVVLMCRGGRSTVLYQELDRERLASSYQELPGNILPFEKNKIVDSCLRWATKSEEKIQFLHSLVLMQRPRLLSTVWNAPYLPETSQDEKPKWLKCLENKGLIRRKDGGLIWVHSQCRNELRAKLAVLDPLKIAVIHEQLADWYRRLLDASEAPAAVFEAVYHYCKAAACAEVACASGYVAAAAGLLRTNRLLVQTQGYSKGSCRQLNYIGQALCEEILRSHRKQQGVICAVRELRFACVELMRSIAREVGEDKKAYERHRQFGRLLLTYSGDSFLTKKMIEWPTAGVAHGGMMDRILVIWPGPLSPQRMRWFRWCGMLAVASRSYERSLSSLNRVIEPARDAGWLLENEGQFTQEQRVEVLRSIECWVQTKLLIYSVCHRLESMGQSTEPAPSLEEIEEMIACGQRLASEIRHADRSATGQDTMQANWADTRLSMHLGACEARRIQQTPLRKLTSNRSAMGILGGAEATLRISDGSKTRAELALIELHRAEVRLKEAEGVVVAQRLGHPRSLGQMCRDLEMQSTQVRRGAQAQQLASDWRVDRVAMRKARALVYDAIRFLERAEPVLRDRRRNVWWTTWFFERYLRAIALCLWSTIFDTKTPIPFLGLEAAMRRTETKADQLLADSVRMVRVDVYHLATAIEAYSSCAKALQLRLILDEKTPRLHNRQHDMLDKYLKPALIALEHVKKLREDVVAKDRMDRHVKRYIKLTVKRVGAIVRDLEQGV